MTTRKAASHGFTLIEILVVIIVLGLLAALVGPRILGRVSEAKSAAARTQIELLGLALDNYRLDNGSYPTTEQGLAALQVILTRDPLPLNWRRPYLRKAGLHHRWGRAYLHKSPGKHNASGYDRDTPGGHRRPGGDRGRRHRHWQGGGDGRGRAQRPEARIAPRRAAAGSAERRREAREEEHDDGNDECEPGVPGA